MSRFRVARRAEKRYCTRAMTLRRVFAFTLLCSLTSLTSALSGACGSEPDAADDGGSTTPTPTPDATPAKDEYHPHSIGGIRFANTYRGSEISNHVYGIAIDIEPDRNTCCGCVPPWTEHPLCQRRVSSIYERMAMPKSWVAIFERFGFYWLGHDVLQDTMHFEFLGDPEKILDRQAPASPSPEAPKPSTTSPDAGPPQGDAGSK